MLACEILMATGVAVVVQGIIERTTGEPCPCKVDKSCPLALRIPLARTEAAAS